MRALCRARQLASTLLTRALPMPELIQGSGSLEALPAHLQETGISRVFLVTTAGALRRGTLAGFLAALKARGMDAAIFSDVSPDPTVECIEAAVAVCRAGNCQTAVAVGGGSVMDCAKMALARLAKPAQPLEAMAGMLKIRKKLLPLYAVPTTAGTGSETTACAVITATVDGAHYKLAVSDLCLVPRAAVLEPALTLTLPPDVTAATGMDALTHAMEAYTNRFASRLVRENALSAVRLIFEALPAAYRHGGDIAAREKMLLASFQAGMAFTRNYVGYVHALAHAVGGLYGVAHGLANAILLPYVMEQYGPGAEKPLAELAAAAGIEGKDAAQRARGFIAAIRQMGRAMDIPEKLAPLRREDFDEIIRRAMAEAYPAYPVPVLWEEKDFRALLEKVAPRD